MPSYESLLERIRQAPREHLGRRSVSRIDSYFIGYNLARRCWGLPDVPRALNYKREREWLDGKIHLCSHNLQSFCLLVTETETEAFDLFFEFQDLKLEECRNDLTVPEDLESKNFNLQSATKSQTLVDFILNGENRGIKKFPAMYFGNQQISGLWAMGSGFFRAEDDLGVTDSSDMMNFELFQLWLNERYPIAKGQTWDKLFYFQGFNSETQAMKHFYENFEMFLEGKEADSPPRWVEEAIEHIKNQPGCQE